MKNITKPLFFTMFCCILQMAAFSQKDWPQEISLQSGGKITIYQPQPESLNGDNLSARSAVSIRKTSDDEPIFGAVWFDANLQTDKDSRTATIESIAIKQTKFPGIEDNDEVSNYAGIIETEVPKFNMEISIDQLLTSIQQEKQLNNNDLKNDAPKIIYKDEPSTLILIDGEPQVQMDDDLKMQRVMNTPFLIVKNPGDNKYYLYGGGFWYASSSITSGYAPVSDLPNNLKSVDENLKQHEAEAQKDQEQVNNFNTPTDIIVSTDPAELIQTEGEPTYKNIQGTSLLYADNTLDDIFKDINSQKTFILIAGRWYSGSSLNGPWTYVPSDQLPEDFSKIPPGSEKDGVLASVAATDEANEAVMDTQIPQTAKVDRTATIAVAYDGDPKFTPIENTSLYVAENSNITVMKSNNRYYAVDNAVWYVSNQATGPWEVSTERPADVENIPPSSPAYDTRYVDIYESTPDYVYMGYTPGYLGNYIYGPTVVWGTGWHYKPWYGHRYYPRPITWGFGMRYNPWTGWNLSYIYGFNDGWFHYGYGMNYGGYYGGWFGPTLYRPPFRPWGWNGGYYHRGYYGGYRANTYISKPRVTVNRPVIIHNNINIYNYNHTNNIYRSRNNVHTNDVVRNPGNTNVNNPNNNRPASDKPLTKPANKPNNVYAGSDGNVYKKDNNGDWQQRDKKEWKPVPQNQLPDLNKDKQSRDRGANRENNFNHATKPAPQQKPPAQKPPAPKPTPKPPSGSSQKKPG